MPVLDFGEGRNSAVLPAGTRKDIAGHDLVYESCGNEVVLSSFGGYLPCEEDYSGA